MITRCDSKLARSTSRTSIRRSLRGVADAGDVSEFTATLRRLEQLHADEVELLRQETLQLRRSLDLVKRGSVHCDGMDEEAAVAETEVPATPKGRQKHQLWPEWSMEEVVEDQQMSELFSSRSLDKGIKLKFDSTSSQQAGVAERLGSCMCEPSDFVLSPLSPIRMVWDMMGVLFLAYDMIWIPMQVFRPTPHIVSQTLEFIVAVYWTLDIGLSFFTGFHSPKGDLVKSLRRIAWHYLTRWLVPDVLIVSVDWIVMGMSFFGGGIPDEGSTESGSGLARLGKVIRIARILRTLRLLRLMKLRHLFFAIQERIDSEIVFILMGTFQNLMVLLFVNHLFACCWFFVGSLGSGMQVHARNQYERTFNVLLILVAMVGFSSFVSAITASMTRLRSLQGNELSEAFLLRRFLKENKISADLQSRVVRYIDMAVEVNKQKTDRSRVRSLNMLSGPLRVELQKELHFPHLSTHPFFKTYAKDNSAINQVCFKALDKIHLSRSDMLFSVYAEDHHMYFLTLGSLYYQRPKNSPEWEMTRKLKTVPRMSVMNRILTVSKDCYFCEPTLWVPWFHQGTMGALVDSETLALDALRFRSITAEYKDIFQSSKRYAINFLKELEEFVDAFGCAWDLPREVTHPVAYPSEELCTKTMLEEQQINELKMCELLEACIDDDMDSETELSDHQQSKEPSLIMEETPAGSISGLSKDKRQL
eukprot:gb/GFBE01064985.1/.p1 GENE.gb/GFBE01064985.1/~~gb/GFBE01064985.1/.p1  ORF type:complete len:703 (+),score=143.80 gb/GFBE01064985.1/:1-2109(+)